MHKISCSSCEQIVEIAPGSTICSACGEDLIRLIPAEGTPQHYYTRAELLIEKGDIDGALRVVQDGLTNVSSSDLLLLGAILGEKAGQYDLMRHYVSRIPVDDSLRVEGEWLLRAHQARQRAQRQGRDPSRAILDQMAGEFGPPPAIKNDVDQEQQPSYVARRSGNPPGQRWLGSVLALLLLVGMVGFSWFYGGQLLSQAWVPEAFRRNPTVNATSSELPIVDDSTINSGTTNSTPSDSLSSDNSSPNSSQPATVDPKINENNQGSTSSVPSSQLPADGEPSTGESGEPPTPAVTIPAPTLSADTPLKQDEQAPTTNDGTTSPIAPLEGAPDINAPNETDSDESIPNNLTDVATPEPVVDSNPQSIVGVVLQERFDILKYLREYGRPDLAELPLDAQIEDGKVFVSGVVKWYEEREGIIEALRFAPGVESINAIDLKTRTPETYTIQEADTLWIIASRIYGDGARWPQIYELNQDALISPDTLGLGQVLKLPPR